MSFRMQIDPRSRKAARFISSVQKQIQAAYLRASKRGLNQQAIAQSLGVDRSTVNKRLLGTSNLTLRSISDLAWAMGESVRLVIEPNMENVPGRNYNVDYAATISIIYDQVTRSVDRVPISTVGAQRNEDKVLVTDEHV